MQTVQYMNSENKEKKKKSDKKNPEKLQTQAEVITKLSCTIKYYATRQRKNTQQRKIPDR